jgi:diguanylate cyclase (GGDEF)-like protein
VRKNRETDSRRQLDRSLRWYQGVGAFIGLFATILIYMLSRLPWGWGVAAFFTAVGGLALARRVGRLKDLSEHDELTGVSNRRPFERLLHRTWERAVKRGRPVSLLFLDIDDFGKVNKIHGHLMGDEALKVVCRQIRQCVRRTDLLARWGGEEFVVLLPETDLGQATMIAERIRSLVHQAPIRFGDRSASITVSTGVATFPGPAHTPDELLKQAMDGQSAAKVKKNVVMVVS